MLGKRFKMGPEKITTTVDGIRFSLLSIISTCILVATGWLLIMALVQLSQFMSGKHFSLATIFDPPGLIGLIAFLMMAIVPSIYRSYLLAHRWFSFESIGLCILLKNKGRETQKVIPYQNIERLIIGSKSWLNPKFKDSYWISIAHLDSHSSSQMPKLVWLGPKDLGTTESIKTFLMKNCPKMKVFDQRAKGKDTSADHQL